VYTIVSGFSC